MNLFYESYPDSVQIDGEEYRIATDFRNYISLIDAMKDDDLRPSEKLYVISAFFIDDPPDIVKAVDALSGFVQMSGLPKCGMGQEEDGQDVDEKQEKNVFSFSIDYPCILSGFLHDYNIDLQAVPYLHWWKFRMLFDNLSADTEIMQRIHYRSVDLNDIKDKDERNRVAKIKRRIQLPEEQLSDYDIGDAFF